MKMLDALEDLSRLLGQRADTAPDREKVTRARNLRGHIDEYIAPRAKDLTTPLLVVILGSTGAGKSSLFNALAGRSISPVGVLRPTTRVAQALMSPDDSAPSVLDQLSTAGSLTIIEDSAARSGMILIDSPDFDSIDDANRALSRRLLEAADLVIFVTTDTRYADDVPWSILRRALERGVPMLTLINRLPTDDTDRNDILEDFRRLLDEGGIDALDLRGSIGVVGVEKDALDLEFDALDRSSVAPVTEVLDGLRGDDEGRKELIRQSLERAIEGLSDPIDAIAGELEMEARAAVGLLSTRDQVFGRQLNEISERIDRGTFLRTEILREWQDFVGANRVSRVISEGIGKLAATIRSAFNPGPAAPAREIKESAFEDLVALLVSQAGEASANTAARWAEDPYGFKTLESDPSLWGASSDLGERARLMLDKWGETITAEVRELGENRRGVARIASLGINVVGTGAILAVFVQTGGLTGAEAGIAAVTAVVNQTLLEAIFGEGNVSRFVDNARARLDAAIADLFGKEASRWDRALDIAPESANLSANLREALGLVTRGAAS